jgi:type 1 glutamine amidotransferase
MQSILYRRAAVLSVVLSCSAEGPPAALGDARDAGANSDRAVGSGGSSANDAGTAGLGDTAAGGTASGGTAGAPGGAGGESAAGGESGAGPRPARRLERVLAWGPVDTNPTTGALRGHNGSGEDEKLLQALGAEHGFEVIVTDDAGDFSADNLARFDVVAFSSPHYTTQKLSATSRAALEAFVRAGGGFIGWHYALHVEADWAFMKVLGGGVTALGHVGGEQESTYTFSAAGHPVTQTLPETVDVTDDFVRLSGDVRANGAVTVLATAALTAHPGGDGHPVIWVHAVDEGRVFYSMLGHNGTDFQTPWSKTLMWNALRWVTRLDE